MLRSKDKIVCMNIRLKWGKISILYHALSRHNEQRFKQVLHKFEKKKTLLALVLIEREDAALWLSSIKFLAWILLCNAGYRPRFNPCSWGIQQWQGNQIWPVQSTLRKERTLHVSKVCQRGNGWGTLMGSNEVLAVFKKKRTFLKV